MHLRALLLLVFCLIAAPVSSQPSLSTSVPISLPMNFIHTEIAAHEGQSGVYVLERGSDALVARAWLADNATQTIDVQYFIWSTDNIGMLAMEALLRAAERGVKVRVIVDDLMVKMPDKTLLALALHPNIDIRIYNPKVSVGVPFQRKVLNLLTGFREMNQRMHDKTFVVDGKLAIAGGRNMATEYFDYNHGYNFRDRDALLFGEVVKPMTDSFQNFWSSRFSVAVEELFDGFGLMQKHVTVRDAEVRKVYADLHAYAASSENFAPEVRNAISDLPSSFSAIARDVVWCRADFISDVPGKDTRPAANGELPRTAEALARLVESAQRSVTIQSPYLVLSDEAMAIFERARARGVTVRINTNSLASTDNLPAFSGYRNQRAQLLRMGLEIYEYKPAPEVKSALVRRIGALKKEPPVFALHAKTMVVDSRITFIGTYNLDPRSQNLNTELGVVVHDEGLSRAVEQAIEVDMQPGNSWNAAKDNPDQYVGAAKRSKVRAMQLLPIQPLL
jgi:putative cardiolipin synthase